MGTGYTATGNNSEVPEKGKHIFILNYIKYKQEENNSSVLKLFLYNSTHSLN
jgi:hypothetical protein